VIALLSVMFTYITLAGASVITSPQPSSHVEQKPKVPAPFLSRLKIIAFEALILNPSKVTFGQNQPVEASYRNYYDPSDTFPECITSVFADEEMHDELRGYALPTKHSEVRNDYCLLPLLCK